MKVTKEVEVKAKPAKAAVPAHKKVVEIHLCDLCESTINKNLDNRYGSGASQCCLCKREICRKGSCMITEFPDGGDYGEKYCKICHDLKYGKYRLERQGMFRRHEYEEDELENKIKKESLNYGR